MSGFCFRTHVLLFILPVVLGDAIIQEGVGDGVIDDVVDMGENAAKGLYHVGSAIWDGAEYAWDNWLEENSLSIAESEEHNGNNFYDMLDEKSPTVKTERAVAREKALAEEHNGNNFYDMLDDKSPTVKTERAVAREKALAEEKKYYWDMLRRQTPDREKALAEEHNINGNKFYDLLDGKTYSDEEMALGWSLSGFFKKLVQSEWGTVVTTFDDAFEATGLDDVVHLVTHGERLFNEDGSYNNQLAEYAFSSVVKAVETVFEKTGLDNVVHEITGAARAYNPDTGEWDPRVKELLDEGKRIMEVFANGVDFNFVKKQSEDLINSIKGSLRSLGKIFTSDMLIDSTGFQILKDVLDGKRSIHDPSTKQAVEDYFNNQAMKAIEKIRYRCGLVDTRGSNGERIGTVMVGASAEVEFIAGASAGVMGAVSIPFSGTEEVEFGGYWTVGLDFGLQAGGGASFPICYSWNEKPSGIPGFGLTVSTGFSAGPVGFGIDVAWALNTDANEFKLNTVCIQYQPGAEFELAVQASYTGALFDVAKIHLTKPSLEDMGIIKSEQDSIETGWERCASEGENCKCYGSVRFGGKDTSLTIETEKWNVLDMYEGGPESTGIPCTREKFGEGLTGVDDPYCECQNAAIEESVSDADEEVGGFWDEMEYAAEDVFDFGVDVVKTGADVLYDAADIILEENSVADSDYHLGTSGATTCMSGYGPITTPEGCKTASKALNKKFGGKGKGKNPYRLPYCWIGSKHSSVNFNPNGDSGDQKTPARLVCKKLESADTKKGTKTPKSKVGKANLPSALEESVANTEKISGSVSQSISRNTTLNSALLVLGLFGLANVLYSSYGFFLKVSDYIKVPEEQVLRV